MEFLESRESRRRFEREDESDETRKSRSDIDKIRRVIETRKATVRSGGVKRVIGGVGKGLDVVFSRDRVDRFPSRGGGPPNPHPRTLRVSDYEIRHYQQ